MTLLDRVTAVVPRSRRTIPGWTRLAAVPVVVAVVVAGVWITGGLLTDDSTLAMALTALWFAGAGAAAVFVGLRWRPLALPVLVTYALTAAVVGGGLLYASTRDVVVDEQVVAVPSTAPDPTPAATGSPAGEPAAPAQPRALARGDFVSAAHSTRGTATLVEAPDGRRLLTLTGFATDPGPDLRVYLVRGDGTSVRGFRDLGRLKGNKGDQQYRLPADVAPDQAGAVVVWCRAFSVAFGRAPLA
jgi:hypothetical protein